MTYQRCVLNRLFSLFIFLLSLTLVQPSIASHKTISLDGQWRFSIGNLQAANQYSPDIDDSQWSSIHVPSNWYLEGYDIAGIAWYRRRFSLTEEDIQANKLITLKFDAVDYTADVWLNGHYLGFHEGMSTPFYFDISEQAKAGDDNIIAVKVNSPNEEIGSVWSLRKRLIKGIFNHHDTRPGGAWSPRGQEQNTGGIWGDVYLNISNKVSVQDFKIHQNINLENNSVQATIDLDISHRLRKGSSYDIDISITPDNFIGTSLKQRYRKQKINAGSSILSLPVSMSNIKLWWPKDYGKPHMYKVSVSISENNNILHTINHAIGFRKVEYQSDIGKWFINGKSIFLRGTNYIATQWLSEMDQQKFAFDVGLMLAANINIVRVHAHLEPKIFYTACDYAGLMVWQDFPLQWGYSESAEFSKEAKKQLTEAIPWLYNHPSVVAWSLHNEPPWDADWMKYKYPDYDPNQNKALNASMYETAIELDSSRYIHKFSATKEHPWLGWYSGKWQDYQKPTKEKIISEFGAQALPDLHALRYIFSTQEIWPDNKKEWDKWDYHNFQQRETFEIAKVKKGKNIDEFIFNTQSYQSKITQYAAESYRRQKYKPVGAAFQFMFVENWPSINWAVVDYWRKPKPAYYALQKAFQPVLPSIEWHKNQFTEKQTLGFKFWVINDLQTDFMQAQLEYSLSRGHKLVEQFTQYHDIARDSVIKVNDWQHKTLPTGKYELVLRLKDSAGKVLGINNLSFSVAGK